MAYFVYVTQSEQDGSYYVGSTENVSLRLKRHNLAKRRWERLLIRWTDHYNSQKRYKRHLASIGSFRADIRRAYLQ